MTFQLLRYYCTLLLFALFFTNTVQAKSRTCAEKIQRMKRQEEITVTAFPVVGWLAGLMIIPQFVLQRREIKILQAATAVALANEDAEISMPLGKAHEHVDHFYQKLIKRYPETELGRDEIISVLHNYNINGVSNGQCDPYACVIDFLFPDKKTANYLKIDAAWQQKNKKAKKRLDQAAAIRSQKNQGQGGDVIEY